MSKKGKNVFIKVRGYHLDIYRHVNNARYLEFLEEARWEVFDNTFRDGFLEESNLAFTVININISYRSAAVVHDTLRIETSLKAITSRSVTVLQEVWNKEENRLVATADVVFVLVSIEKQKAIQLRPEFIAKLEKCFSL
ncbi:UNVERIFIED_CONTAM: hypothetical protein GTU68_060694 [Idotea baltica]|nr:hypothetical protein [Idotea baltica]